jgi:hypothetical protein
MSSGRAFCTCWCLDWFNYVWFYPYQWGFNGFNDELFGGILVHKYGAKNGKISPYLVVRYFRPTLAHINLDLIRCAVSHLNLE